jgi:hypothetical protein
MQVRKLSDEVYADYVPMVLRNGEWMKLSDWTMPLNLSPKAEIACLRILINVAGHLWPPVIAGDKLWCLPVSDVSCNFGVMML